MNLCKIFKDFCDCDELYLKYNPITIYIVHNNPTINNTSESLKITRRSQGYIKEYLYLRYNSLIDIYNCNKNSHIFNFTGISEIISSYLNMFDLWIYKHICKYTFNNTSNNYFPCFLTEKYSNERKLIRNIFVIMFNLNINMYFSISDISLIFKYIFKYKYVF